MLISSQIIVGGDSAGANLALALASHILHPHPQVPKLSLTDEFFKGIVLISPWVTFDQTAPAFERNAKKDTLVRTALRNWSDAFMGHAERDNYNSPLDASPDWWDGIPAEDILVLTGADELFVDDITEFAKKLQVSCPLTYILGLQYRLTQALS